MSSELNILNWVMALLPILVVLVLMMVLRWSGGKAGGLGWFLALGIALVFFGGNVHLFAVASLKGLWTTVFILYIIWGAMALYNIVNQVGGFHTIAATFTNLTGGNRILQLLVIGWAFPSFLQGVCGFGTPVAVAAPLLVGLGFSPVVATATALLGHAWAVTFGSLGSSYGALLKMTELSPEGIALWASLFLAVVCVFTGLCISLLYGGRKGLAEGLPAAVIMGMSMGGTLMLVANFVLPYVASVLAGVVGLVVGGAILPRTPWYRSNSPGDAREPRERADSVQLSFHAAFAPYYILLALVLGVYLSPLKGLLSPVKVGLAFPGTATSLGFSTLQTASYSPITILTTPGTLIFLSVVLSVMFYTLRRLWRPGYSGRVVRALLRQAVPATVTVMTMSMMAVVMMEAGMTRLLATGTSQLTRSAYPVVAPYIGVLGAFMTGSNTSSNILFGAFQREVAGFLGISAWVVAAMQTTGGAIGNAISPLNVALGTGVTNIVGREGEVIKRVLGYTLLLALGIGVLGYLCVYFLVPWVP